MVMNWKELEKYKVHIYISSKIIETQAAAAFLLPFTL